MTVKLRKRKLSKGKYSLYLDYTIRGVRKTEWLKIYLEPGQKSFNDQRLYLANQRRAQFELNMQYMEAGLLNPELQKSNFFEYLDKYISAYKKTDIQKFTALRVKLRLFHGAGPLRCSDINEKFCYKLIDFFESQLTGSSPYDYFKCFSKVLSNATSDGYFLKSPSEEVQNRNRFDSQVRKDFLTDAEIQKIAETPYNNTEAKRMFLFATQTGMRFVDCVNLRRKHIKLPSIAIVDFNQSKTDGKSIFDLNDAAVQLLGELSDDQEARIFSIVDHHIITRHVKALVKEAGIKKHITFHCARHSAVTNLLMKGLSSKKAGLMVGHKSSKTTAKYDHLTMANMKEGFTNLERLNLNNSEFSTSKEPVQVPSTDFSKLE